MDLGQNKEKVISEEIPGFERAGAKLEVNVGVIESPNSTIPIDTLKKLSEGEYEKLKDMLKKNNGVPLKYLSKISNGAYLIESSITFDAKTEWGKLLDDSIVSMMLRNGFATWVYTDKGGIRLTNKIRREDLEVFNITPKEIYNHPLHDWFSTPTGKSLNQKNFMKVISRNK